MLFLQNVAEKKIQIGASQLWFGHVYNPELIIVVSGVEVEMILFTRPVTFDSSLPRLHPLG